MTERTKKQDYIVGYASTEININDNQIVQIDEVLLPPYEDTINSLIKPVTSIDEQIANLTVDINRKLFDINTIGVAATGCGCGVTVGIGSTQVAWTGTHTGYDRVTITRQDSESINHTGVNPYSVDIFGSTSNLTSGVAESTTTVPANFGRGVRTNVIELTGIGNTAFTPTINPVGVSTCIGITCAGLAASATAIQADLVTLRAERARLLSLGGNTIKEELKVQYTRRHGLVWAKNETQARTNVLKNVRNFTTNPDNQQFFDE